jgi:hypothetical protein
VPDRSWDLNPEKRGEQWMRLQSKRIRGFLKAFKTIGVLGPLGPHLVPGVMVVVEGVIRAFPSRAPEALLVGALNTQVWEHMKH